MDEMVNPVDTLIEMIRTHHPEAQFNDEAVAAMRAYCDAPA